MNNFSADFLNDGLTRRQRTIPSLLPDTVKIDDRNIFDLARLMHSIASEFNFYNYHNEPDGDWESFLKNNLYVLEGIITGYDDKNTFESYKKYKIRVKESADPDHLFDNITELLKIVNSFNRLLTDVCKQLNVTQWKTEKILEHVAKDNLDFYGLVTEIQHAFGRKIKLRFAHLTDDEAENPAPLASKILTEFDSQKQLITDLLPDIDRIFSSAGYHYFHLKDHLPKNDIRPNEMEPHISIFITFLNLFTHLQNQINGIPKKHLEHYYRDILGFRPAPPLPDEAYLVLELASNIEELVIKPELKFVAKTESATPNIEYNVGKDVLVNKAAIADIKTLYLEGDVDGNNIAYISGIFKATPKLNDVKTILKFPDLVKPWALLGESQRNLNDSEQNMEHADIGIIVSSPVLYLQEGVRNVSIKIIFRGTFCNDCIWAIEKTERFPQPSTGYRISLPACAKYSGKWPVMSAPLKILPNASNFIVNCTGSESWFEILRFNARWRDSAPAGNKSSKNTSSENQAEFPHLEISFELKEEDEALAAYSAAIHGGSYAIDYPAIRITLSNSGSFRTYSFLKKFSINQLNITSTVSKYKNVQLKNSLGTLNPAIPFQIFGPIPLVGSYLDIKDTNVFNKYTKKLNILIEWLDLPYYRQGFKDYYNEYDLGIKNESFKIYTGSVQNGRYIVNTKDLDEENLFRSNDQTLLNTTYIEFNYLKNIRFNNSMKMLEDKEETDFNTGVLRLELNSPAQGFGHREFPQVFSDTAMGNSKLKIFGSKRTLPNTPYIPMVKKILLGYTLEQKTLMKTNNADSQLQLVQLQPFGHSVLFPQHGDKFHLLPQLRNESNLHIGLKNIKQGQELTLFFQFSNDNVYKVNNADETISWYYLADNEWKEIDHKTITQDTTYDLTATGIVKITLPGDICAGNTIMNPELCWLRVSIRRVDNLDQRPFRVIGIYTQVALVKRTTVNTEYPTLPNLPPGSIAGFSVKNYQFENVFQPFHSFNGKKAQTVDSYYVDAGERLRNKARAVTARDVLQSVLAHFPGILVAKCIDPQSNPRLAPGTNLYVVVIPKQLDKKTAYNKQVYVDIPTLIQIKNHLEKITTAYTRIQVKNVHYENVKVICYVAFKPENGIPDNGLYTRMLNDVINDYIAPWMADDSSDIKIGAPLNVHSFLNKLKNLPYVAHITGFSILHFFVAYNSETNAPNKVRSTRYYRDGVVSPSVPEAVFIPAEQHMINLVPESEIKSMAKAGLTTLRLRGELVVGPGRNDAQTQKELPNAKSEDNEPFIITFNI